MKKKRILPIDTSYHPIRIHSATYTLYALNTRLILNLETVQYKYVYTPIHECVVFLSPRNYMQNLSYITTNFSCVSFLR